MWIAKPLQKLSGDECKAWERSLQHRNAPLSQSFAWANATLNSGIPTYLVFSPDENVGGWVHEPTPGNFECTNGPLLAWNLAGQNPQTLVRQLATFSMGVSKLHSGFKNLILKPRLCADELPPELKRLPIQPLQIQKSSTWILPLADNFQRIQNGFSQRLKRTLSQTQTSGFDLNWSELSTHASGGTPSQNKSRVKSYEELSRFVLKLAPFSALKGFYVPPHSWFKSLIFCPENAQFTPSRFYIATAQHQDCISQILIGFQNLGTQNSTATYLFGFQERTPHAKSRISASAAAHVHAIQKLIELGASHYDFNGYLPEAPSDHPYAGINDFKRQFGGGLLTYTVPEYRIT